jgi:hypothetical protein
MALVALIGFSFWNLKRHIPSSYEPNSDAMIYPCRTLLDLPNAFFPIVTRVIPNLPYSRTNFLWISLEDVTATAADVEEFLNQPRQYLYHDSATDMSLPFPSPQISVVTGRTQHPQSCTLDKPCWIVEAIQKPCQQQFRKCQTSNSCLRCSQFDLVPVMVPICLIHNLFEVIQAHLIIHIFHFPSHRTLPINPGSV